MAGKHSINRVKFTKGRVDAVSCPPDKAEFWLWDSETPGLALRARGDQVRYVFQRKLAGRMVRIILGAREAWPLETVWAGKGDNRTEIQRGARQEARRLSGLIDRGIDPRLEKTAQAKATAEQRQHRDLAAVTLGEAWDHYVGERSPGWSKGHADTHHQAMMPPGLPHKKGARTVGGALHGLRGERLEALTPQTIAAWLEAETARRPTTAALAYRLLRTFLGWASERPEYQGIIEPAALLTSDVKRLVPRQKPKNDVLQREQLPAWFASVKALPPIKAAYLQALLLTGARPGELIELQWADLDFQWLTLTIRDKAAGTRTIPLPPYTAALLEALPRLTLPDGRPNPWVFTSVHSSSGRISEANHAHSQAVADAGLPHITLHGLRRSFGTLSEWCEVPVGVVAQVMGHKPSAIAEKHYRRRPLDLLRQWHTKIEAWILREAGQ